MRLRILSWLLAFVFVLPAFSQEDDDERRGLIFDLPIVDLPYNSTDGGFQFPSMRQSMAISTGFYQGIHHAIGENEEPPLLRKLGIISFDVLTGAFPLSNAWLHEEWHRAIMGRHGISSHNDTYYFAIGKGVINVSRVGDEDLTRLKRDFPADQVRLSSAGIESQYEQNLQLEKLRFFHETPSWDRFLIAYNHFNNIFYLNTCADGSADKITDLSNTEEGTDVPKRDFTGLDCTAWVYDLYRPDEPYAARGTHPSGVGINRYRKYSDLREEEKQFLRTQVNLSFLNLVDPFMFGYDEFEGGVFGFGEKWNATLRHHITSFGYSIEGNLFVKEREQNWLFIFHNFVNAARYFPGLTVELERWPMPRSKFKLTSRVSFWLQPERQRVKSTESVPGLLASAMFAYPLTKHIEATFGVDGKTEGWVAGNPYLERNASMWSGAVFLF